jgi:beta-glucanase (GH16 family)
LLSKKESLTEYPKNCPDSKSHPHNYSIFKTAWISSNSNNPFSTKYGKLQARIKLPRNQGVWASIWAYSQNSNKTNNPNTIHEVDFFEYLPFKKQPFQFATHSQKKHHAIKFGDKVLFNDWIDFEVIWDKDYYEIRINNKLELVHNRPGLNSEASLRVSIEPSSDQAKPYIKKWAGTWPPELKTDSLSIDYIKLWVKD